MAGCCKVMGHQVGMGQMGILRQAELRKRPLQAWFSHGYITATAVDSAPCQNRLCSLELHTCIPHPSSLLPHLGTAPLPPCTASAAPSALPGRAQGMAGLGKLLPGCLEAAQKPPGASWRPGLQDIHMPMQMIGEVVVAGKGQGLRVRWPWPLLPL